MFEGIKRLVDIPLQTSPSDVLSLSNHDNS